MVKEPEGYRCCSYLLQKIKPQMSLRNIGIIVIALVAIGAAFFFMKKEEPVPVVVEEKPEFSTERTIGTSVEGRKIDAYTFGNGAKKLLFVGGIHGGYEWNSVFIAYRLIDYIKANPNIIPENIALTIIPSLNPDGLYAGIGAEGRFSANETPSVEKTVPGRFNANGVDLNRNFDCKWQPTSTWRSQEVSAGSEPFSEPETKALKDYILETQPSLVAFWHSQGGAVYGAVCGNEIDLVSKEIIDIYGKASGYSSYETFDAYPVTGDAEGWLASIGIPAITIELATHETIEWEQNLAGTKALLEYYAGK